MIDITVLTASIGNRRSMLVECIESVVLQELKPVAHKIVIDSNRNGNWWTYNQLLDSAETEWVCFVDDDDILYPNHLSKLAEHAAHNDVIFSNCDCNDTTDWLHYHKPFSEEELRQNSIVPMTALVRKSALINAGGFDTIQGCDYSMWIKILNNGGRFKKIDDVTWNYRFHDTNYSRKGVTW